MRKCGPCENVSRPFASDTSPKRIDREGLGKRRTETRQREYYMAARGYEFYLQVLKVRVRVGSRDLQRVRDLA